MILKLTLNYLFFFLCSKVGTQAGDSMKHAIHLPYELQSGRIKAMCAGMCEMICASIRNDILEFIFLLLRWI